MDIVIKYLKFLLSFFLGIVIGDCAELEALRVISTRRVLVVDTVKPFAATVLGNILLDENLYPLAFVGIILTAMWVYIVLIASMEKIKQVKEKKRRGHNTRLDDDSHGSLVLDDTFEDEKELLSIFDGEEAEFSMVGMARRPLSRHDLGVDIDELFEIVEEDNLMMVLEDGRGIIDNSICCAGLDRAKSFSSTGSNGWSDGNDWTVPVHNRSFNSMGSMEELNMDVVVAMENFDRDNEDEFYIGDNYVENSPPVEVLEEVVQYHIPNKEENERSEQVIMSILDPSGQIAKTSTTEKTLKSVLKKSRYTPKKVSNSDRQDLTPTQQIHEEDLSSNLLNNKYDQSPQSPTCSNLDKNNILFKPIKAKDNSPEYYRQQQQILSSQGQVISNEEGQTLIIEKEAINFTPKKRPTPLRLRTSSSTSVASSSGSLVSFESECGPPPGLYGNNIKNKETKLQRSARIRTGYLLALMNVLLDSYGAYLTKKHGVGMSTWEINLCRLGFAGIVMTSISFMMNTIEGKRKKKKRMQREQQQKMKQYLLTNNTDSNNDDTTLVCGNNCGTMERYLQSQQRPSTLSTSNHTKIRPWFRLPRMSCISWMIVSLGVCFVTFLAPALTQYSLFQIPLALSVSLCSITPLYTIPLGIILKRGGERPSRRGCLGAGLSVLGVIILCCFGVDVETLD